MSQCSKCGAVSQAGFAFCTQCGNAVQSPSNPSIAGRPVISMDPHKQGQVSESSAVSSAQTPQQPITPYQISNIQPSQFQTSPVPLQVTGHNSNSNKIALGAVGIIVAIAIVFLLGSKDSESPNVAPSNQQSGSSSDPTEDIVEEEYAETYLSYDDYPYDFRGTFMSSCTVEATYEICLCSLENLETIYSIDELGWLYDSGDDLTWLYDQIARGCY